MRRSRAIAFVLSVWGAAVVIRGLVVGLSGPASYQSGEVAGMIFGLALVAFGARTLRRDFYKAIIPPPRDQNERPDDGR